MNQRFFLLLLLSFLVLHSCKKEDEPPICNTTPAVPAFFFPYDKAALPRSVVITQFGNDPTPGWSFTEELTYEFTNKGWFKKITQVPNGSTTLWRHYHFRYSADSVVVDLDLNGSWFSREIYVYNQAGLVLGKHYIDLKSGKLDYQELYTYGSDDLLTKIVRSNLDEDTSLAPQVLTFELKRTSNSVQIGDRTYTFEEDAPITQPMRYYPTNQRSGELQFYWGFDPLLHPNHLAGWQEGSHAARFEYEFDANGRIIKYQTSNTTNDWVDVLRGETEYIYK